MEDINKEDKPGFDLAYNVAKASFSLDLTPDPNEPIPTIIDYSSMSDLKENSEPVEYTQEDIDDANKAIGELMDETNAKIEEEVKRTITFNIDFLSWYFTKNKNIISDEQKQLAFSLMTQASMEDPACFMRIILYIANTRSTDEEELAYKMVLHFICVMYPDWVIANTELIIGLGKKDDVLYLLQAPNMAEKAMKWIKHKMREDDDFKSLEDGKLIGTPINRRVRYKPRLGRNSKWTTFLFKILDDPTFNGISC